MLLSATATEGAVSGAVGNTGGTENVGTLPPSPNRRGAGARWVNCCIFGGRAERGEAQCRWAQPQGSERWSGYHDAPAVSEDKLR